MQLSVTPWTVAHQAPLSMGFPRQEYWSGLPLPSPGDHPDLGIKPVSPAWQMNSLPVSHLKSCLMDRLYDDNIDSPERGDKVQRTFNKNPNKCILFCLCLASMVRFMNNSSVCRITRIIMKILKNKSIIKGSFVTEKSRFLQSVAIKSWIHHEFKTKSYTE